VEPLVAAELIAATRGIAFIIKSASASSPPRLCLTLVIRALG